MEKEELRLIVRRYRSNDRAVVREICADTGFLGRPIDPVFEDRELFADYLTSYYTDIEPEATVVCELDGVVKGYVMGSRFPKRKTQFERRLLPSLFFRGLWRYFMRPYKPTTRRYVRWLLTRARKENPYTPPDIPHFHVNIRAEARTVATSREMVDRVFNFFAEQGEKQIYGQVVVFEDRRSPRLFERWGFRVIDKREVTKYRDMDPRRIFLFTVVKDLTLNRKMYGTDLHKIDAIEKNT